MSKAKGGPRRKSAAEKRCEEQVLAAVELASLSFVVAAKSLAQERLGVAPDVAEAFGEELWRTAAGMMVKVISQSESRREAGHGKETDGRAAG